MVHSIGAGQGFPNLVSEPNELENWSLTDPICPFLVSIIPSRDWQPGRWFKGTGVRSFALHVLASSSFGWAARGESRSGMQMMLGTVFSHN